MVYVIKNEQHQLTTQQKQALETKFDNDEIEFINVPIIGLTQDEIEGIAAGLGKRKVVFLSPIPYLMKLLILSNPCYTFVFHNDKREKKELPNGKVIMTVPQDGWEIL